MFVVVYVDCCDFFYAMAIWGRTTIASRAFSTSTSAQRVFPKRIPPLRAPSALKNTKDDGATNRLLPSAPETKANYYIKRGRVYLALMVRKQTADEGTFLLLRESECLLRRGHCNFHCQIPCEMRCQSRRPLAVLPPPEPRHRRTRPQRRPLHSLHSRHVKAHYALPRLDARPHRQNVGRAQLARHRLHQRADNVLPN